MRDDIQAQFPAYVSGVIVESHLEPFRVPRWPKIRWLRWIQREEFIMVIDKFHLTGVHLRSSLDDVLTRRNFTVKPEHDDGVVGPVR